MPNTPILDQAFDNLPVPAPRDASEPDDVTWAALKSHIDSLTERLRQNDLFAAAYASEVRDLEAFVAKIEARVEHLKAMPRTGAVRAELQEYLGASYWSAGRGLCRHVATDGLLQDKKYELAEITRRCDAAVRIAKATKKLIEDWPDREAYARLCADKAARDKITR